MHDTMSPVNTIKSAANMMKNDIISGESKLSKDDLLKLLNGIMAKSDEVNMALDAFYVKSKQDGIS